MNDLQIVDYIQKNPIEKLSPEGNYKLAARIKALFTTEEQQLSSFLCSLQFNDTPFPVDLDNFWEWIGYTRKHGAKNYLDKHFQAGTDFIVTVTPSDGDSEISSTDDETKDEDCEEQQKKKKRRGGHNKETILLTKEAFKRFCFKSQTTKTSDIQELFLKIEKIVVDVLTEEVCKLQEKLAEDENRWSVTQTSEQRQKELIREATLLEVFSDREHIFYMMRVKTLPNGEWVVKIGESRKGVVGRYKEHTANYGECTLLDCFHVNKCKEFETFMKEHKELHPHRYKSLPGHEKELELFHIGHHLTYKKLKQIVKKNIESFAFDLKDFNKVRAENEYLQIVAEQSIQSSCSSSLKSTMDTMMDTMTTKMQNLEEKICAISQPAIASTATSVSVAKMTTGFGETLKTFGPRLQKINPETLQIVKIYDIVTDAMREDYNLKRPSLTKAINENTIYLGFRWQLVDRDLDPTVIHHLPPTKEVIEKERGYIAKLDDKKTKILNVYIDRKTAALANGYSHAGLDVPVMKGNITNGNYYTIYDKCSPELRASFESHLGRPLLLFKDGLSVTDAKTGEVTEFACKYDAIRLLRMSDKTITKALAQDIPFNGGLFKMIGSRVKCLPEDLS